jgi:F-type H+-transporting ATPase subunit delta
MSKHNSEDKATLNSYAQALLDLADARGVTTQVAEDVQGIAQMIEQDPAFRQYMNDPSVSRTGRAEALDRVFGPRVPGILSSFLKLLDARQKLSSFPAMAAAFKELLDKRSGNIEVEITVPHALNDGELHDVRNQISHKLGKNASVKQKVDESIIGGMVLRIGDSLIDGSVKTQLETIKRRMIAAV